MGITALIVGAVSYIGFRIWRTIAGSKDAAGCGSCGHDASNGESKNELVPLDALAGSADKLATRN